MKMKKKACLSLLSSHNYTLPETIAYETIQLLISKTISKAFTNRVLRQEGDYSYSYLQGFIEPIIQLVYFQYESDEGGESIEGIEEPIKPTYDRDAFTLITYKCDKGKCDDQLIDELGEEPQIRRKKSLKPDDPIGDNLSLINPISHSKLKVTKLRKERTIQSFDMISSDIANKNTSLRFDVENIEQLRSEFEQIKLIQKIKQEEEDRKRKTKEERQIQKQKQTSKEQSSLLEFDMSKYTIDAECNVIPYLPISQRRLREGFNIPLSDYKKIGDNNQENDSLKEGSVSHYRVFNHSTMKAKQTNSSLQEASTASDSLASRRYFKVNPSIKQEVYKRDIPKGIVVSGNNFDLLTPETGVIVRNVLNDRNMKKVGNMDFYQKYNKYSIFEYEKLNEMIRFKNAMMNKSCDDIIALQEQQPVKEDKQSIEMLIKGSRSTKEKESFVRSRNGKKVQKSLSMARIIPKSSISGMKMALDSFASPLPEVELQSFNENSTNYSTANIFMQKTKKSELNYSSILSKGDISDYHQMNKFASTIISQMKNDWGNPKESFNAILDRRGFNVQKSIKRKGEDGVIIKKIRSRLLLKPMKSINTNFESGKSKKGKEKQSPE